MELPAPVATVTGLSAKSTRLPSVAARVTSSFRFEACNVSSGTPSRPTTPSAGTTACSTSQRRCASAASLASTSARSSLLIDRPVRSAPWPTPAKALRFEPPKLSTRALTSAVVAAAPPVPGVRTFSVCVPSRTARLPLAWMKSPTRRLAPLSVAPRRSAAPRVPKVCDTLPIVSVWPVQLLPVLL